MGVLVCVISYVLGFAGCLSAVARIRGDIVDPEGVGGAEFLAIVIALGTLSALFGTRKHQRWLSEHLKGAVLAGVVSGVVTSAALLAFGVVTTWWNNPFVAVLLFVVRFTFIVWPALILSASIAVRRHRSLAHARANAV